MELKEFQLAAVKSLFEAMEKPARDIILKSPTGSGKTIILTYFMHQYIQSFPKTVFVWLTPGKGNLEEQSKAKMDKYIHFFLLIDNAHHKIRLLLYIIQFLVLH